MNDAGTSASTLSRLWPSGQAARFLGISYVSLSDLAKAGKIGFTASPLGRLYDPEEVAALKAERERRQGAQRSKKSA